MRGPPSAHSSFTTYDAVDRWWHGASARSGLTATPVAYTYDDPAKVVRVVASAVTATEASPGTQRTLMLAPRSHVAANSGNRVFWSGGQPAKEAAESFAKANGSKTLEMTAVGRTLEKLPYNRFTAKLWDAASAGFAATARGNANVFIGPSFRGAGSTFGRIEGPILRFKGSPILQRFEDVW